jgi:hypothetical protein
MGWGYCMMERFFDKIIAFGFVRASAFFLLIKTIPWIYDCGYISLILVLVFFCSIESICFIKFTQKLSKVKELIVFEVLSFIFSVLYTMVGLLISAAFSSVFVEIFPQFIHERTPIYGLVIIIVLTFYIIFKFSVRFICSFIKVMSQTIRGRKQSGQD